ncbi:PAS domain-containing sensor histidine kinase [Flaviaesturariibacter terrae]
MESPFDISSVYRNAIDPMWLVSLEEGEQYVFRSINEAFTQVTGLRSEQVLGRTIEEVLPQTSHYLVREKYNLAIRSGRIVDYVEEARHPAGTKYGEIRVIPVRDSGGKISGIIGMANDITEKTILGMRLEEEREQKNRQITRAVLKSQEAERSRIGRELHDNVNQILTTVKLYVELCASGVGDARHTLEKCSALLQESISEIRTLSKQLAAPSLGDISFSDSLKELAESFNQTKRLQVRVDFSIGDCDSMDEDLHLTLYRIAQEQLTNILKHAHAHEARILVSIDADVLRFQLSDDGIGFDVSSVKSGIGITNMKSRVNLLNGSFELASDFEHGTQLTATFPIEMKDGRCRPRLS